jgi:hypothetical protein
MRKIKLAAIFLSMMAIAVTSCKKDEDTTEPPVDPGTSTTDLVSKKTTTAPTIDATIDGGWAACKTLVTPVVVPDPGGNTPITGGNYFRGYVGDTYNVKIRSMYDNEYIYFLCEWNDPTNSQARNSWYFNPSTKRWAQENRYPTFDNAGNKTRDGFYEDKFAFLWNINGSTPNFNTLGCYATCHMGLDLATHFNAPALHYTNGPSEKVDMWHWKLVRTGLYTPGQIDDQYQDNDEFGHSGTTAEGGRKSDAKTSGGSTDNKQTLGITGDTATKVSVPKYVIVGRTNYYAILKSEIDGGTAKKVTAVDANGVLTLEGGATIDPSTDVEFQRKGEGVGSKCIPSVYVEVMAGDRADITAASNHTGAGWVLEFKRKLNTGSATDVVFAPNTDLVFGIGVFQNAALAHAIQSKLNLKWTN